MARGPARGFRGGQDSPTPLSEAPNLRIRLDSLVSFRSSSSASDRADPTLRLAMFDRAPPLSARHRRVSRAGADAADPDTSPVAAQSVRSCATHQAARWASSCSQSPTYVRVSGLGVDPLLVNAAQTHRPGRGWWRNIVDLYGAADILVAEVQLQRLYPGGPARARFIGRHGPDDEIVGGFTLTAASSEALPAMMAEGVRRMTNSCTALAAGALERDPTSTPRATARADEWSRRSSRQHQSSGYAFQVRSCQQCDVLQFRDGPSPDSDRDHAIDPPGDQPGRHQLRAGQLSRVRCGACRGTQRSRLAGDLHRCVRSHGGRIGTASADPAAAAGASAPAAGPASGPAGEQRAISASPSIALPPLAQSSGDSRLIVSDANRQAFDHFRKWTMWPVKATILTGPRRSGRTLLARSFIERVGGQLFDNAEQREEVDVFHAWNQAQDSGRPLVMITDIAPAEWQPFDLRTLIPSLLGSIGLP